jgi:formylglycine-generating enzyme required for sulfatase activity
MWSSIYTPCKIQQTGSSGSFSYSVAEEYANRPVNYVSWGDAARFANWLHNGQPTGAQDLSTTEDGAYYLNGAGGREMSDITEPNYHESGLALLAVTREADWKWAIPTDDEWYKAATPVKVLPIFAWRGFSP